MARSIAFILQDHLYVNDVLYELPETHGVIIAPADTDFTGLRKEWLESLKYGHLVGASSFEAFAMWCGERDGMEYLEPRLLGLGQEEIAGYSARVAVLSRGEQLMNAIENTKECLMAAPDTTRRYWINELATLIRQQVEEGY